MKLVKWLLGTDDHKTKTIHFRPDDAKFGDWLNKGSRWKFTGKRRENGSFETIEI